MKSALAKITLKVWLLIAVFTVGVFLLYGVFFGYRFYRNIFRLSLSQVQNLVVGIEPGCEKITDCNLQRGDILLRRYITSRTWLMDTLAHPFFTHSAFYLGGDQLVEAVGKEKDSEDEIQIATFSKSDWLNADSYNFIIIRPSKNSWPLERVSNSLHNIAEDPGYRFGFSGNKKTSCADLILKQLVTENVVYTLDMPEIVTPDYLFWIAIQNPNDFGVIGYHFK